MHVIQQPVATDPVSFSAVWCSQAAKKALKTVKKADKKIQVYNFKIFSCQNRHSEALEFGDISG